MPTPRRERWKQIKYRIARQREVRQAVCHRGRYGSHVGLPGSTWKQGPLVDNK